MRSFAAETRLSPSDFIFPLFVFTGAPGAESEPIASMPGQWRYPVENVAEIARTASAAGVNALLLFGVADKKNAEGDEAWSDSAAVQEATRRIKIACPAVLIITDVCMCEYTASGACGVENKAESGGLDSDQTLQLYGRIAVSQATAGADIVAPSGMMDGMVSAIRKCLDSSGFRHIPILSYSVKYASALYGPFRDAAQSGTSFGHRKAQQMQPGNGREALREADLDIVEGADLIMVKPATFYLDVIQSLRNRHPEVQIVAYSVSGEYSMIKASAAAGWLQEKESALEMLTAIKRAGADKIITYYALEAAKWLKESE